MKYTTLKEAEEAERQRLIEAGLSSEYAEQSIVNLREITVKAEPPPNKTDYPNPSREHLSKNRWYDTIADIEWGYRSVDHNHGRDFDGYRWMMSVTSASKYNPILSYYRQKYFEEQLNLI